MQLRRMARAAGVVAVLVSLNALQAAPKYVWISAADTAGLATLNSDFAIRSNDLINGLVPLRNNELVNVAPDYVPMATGDPCRALSTWTPHLTHSGFHPVTPDQTGAKLTDGLLGANIDSVLADFMFPSAVFQFDLPQPRDIGEIRVFVENLNRNPQGQLDLDGRVFQHYDVAISTDTNPDPRLRAFTVLLNDVISANIACGPDGYAPNGNDGTIGATLTRVFDDASPTLASSVTSIRFTFYAVSNTGKAFWDQWLGGNTADCPEVTPADVDAQDLDGRKRAFEASIVKEIDILDARSGVPFEICSNGLDDDGDELIDGTDPDCFGTTCPPEDCTNGSDDNGDTLVDCDDPDCRFSAVCNPEDCHNGIDDNGDELVDCDDPQCADTLGCRCNDPFADADGDQDVDQDDFGIWQLCFTGGNAGVIPSSPEYCACFNRDADTEPILDIDQTDLTAFEKCASGPAILAEKDCDGE